MFSCCTRGTQRRKALARASTHIHDINVRMWHSAAHNTWITTFATISKKRRYHVYAERPLRSRSSFEVESILVGFMIPPNTKRCQHSASQHESSGNLPRVLVPAGIARTPGQEEVANA